MQQPVPVTVENFTRAESDMYFARPVAEVGLGKFHHSRTLMPIEKQLVIRANRDTLYSSAVFDLQAGPVTVTLPDAGARFFSLQVFNEDQYVVDVSYKAGPHTYTEADVGTRYMLVGIRTLIDASDPADLGRVHAVQDAIKADQKSPGVFEIPDWDPISQGIVREALVVLAGTLTDTRRMYGAKDEVDPVRFVIGAATGWGANPEKDALYLTVTPPLNDGRKVHRLTVRDVPVDGFWSISLYNADGYFQKNDREAYSLNNLTAKPNEDGSITVQFGGCDEGVANCLPIMPGWNYWVRLYRPRAEILDGRWTFPAAEPV